MFVFFHIGRGYACWPRGGYPWFSTRKEHIGRTNGLVFMDFLKALW